MSRQSQVARPSDVVNAAQTCSSDAGTITSNRSAFSGLTTLVTVTGPAARATGSVLKARRVAPTIKTAIIVFSRMLRTIIGFSSVLWFLVAFWSRPPVRRDAVATGGYRRRTALSIDRRAPA